MLGGGVAALGSLCYAELGVTIPKSGGDYSYVTEIFGGLVGYDRSIYDLVNNGWKANVRHMCWMCCVVLLSRFLLLWSAVLIMYPTTLAVIALTFSNYVLQPVFPYCVPPYIATRLLSTICICECLASVFIQFISLNAAFFVYFFLNTKDEFLKNTLLPTLSSMVKVNEDWGLKTVYFNLFCTVLVNN